MKVKELLHSERSFELTTAQFKKQAKSTLKLFIILLISFPLFTACSAFPFQKSKSSVNLTDSFDAIFAGVQEFNEITNTAYNAKSFEEVSEISLANTEVLGKIRKALNEYSTSITEYWEDLPLEDNYDFPSRQTLKDYQVAMNNWLSIQEEDQRYMAECLLEESTYMGCLLEGFTERVNRQMDASEAVRPILQKLQDWQTEFRS